MSPVNSLSVFFGSCADDINLNSHAKRPGKVRGAKLPQEYELAQFIQDTMNPVASWDTSIPACNWNHVFCNAELQVTKISWGYLSLSGSLKWQYLCHTVREVTLWRNRLTGTVPLDVLPLQMIYLDIENNKFSGELDLSHSPCGMEALLLTENKFRGYLDLTHLPSTMTRLQIAHNQLCGEVGFTHLPDEMEHLNLSQNLFTGPLDLQRLPPAIRFFRCHNNRFSGLVKFDRLPEHLVELDLVNNAKLYGDVDKALLPKNLKHVLVSGTNISSNIK